MRLSTLIIIIVSIILYLVFGFYALLGIGIAAIIAKLVWKKGKSRDDNTF